MVTVGHRCGKLLVISLSFRKNGRNHWLCQCDCGNNKIVIDYSLQKKYGGVKSCGCLLKENCGKQLEDITGKVFGKLTVVSKTDKKQNNKVVWKTICECGNEKLHRASTLKQGKIVSCGCHKIKKSKENRGEKHYNWKGGITSQATKDRNSEQYAIWRREVFERDNYICKACFLSKRELNSHHIESFNKNIELRFIVNNGITLCEDCHNMFHKRFGKLDNNRSQLETFLRLGSR